MALNQSELDSSPATATPQGMIKSEVYIDEESPPYETPLDLRYPLHWDSTAEFVVGGEIGVVPPELELAQAELLPIGIWLSYGQAWGMCHYTGQSPFYFRAEYDDDQKVRQAIRKDIHDKVVHTIQKHLGHLEEHRKPVIRYVKSDESLDYGDEYA